MKNTKAKRPRIARQREEVKDSFKYEKLIGKETSSYLQSIRMAQKIYDCTYKEAKQILHDKRIEKLVAWEFKNLG